MDIDDYEPYVPPVEHWRCYQCGGTGLAPLGETCEDCDGYGFC